MRSQRNRRRRTARETVRQIPRHNGPCILPLSQLIKFRLLDYSMLGDVARKLPLENTRIETTLPERIGGDS